VQKALRRRTKDQAPSTVGATQRAGPASGKIELHIRIVDADTGRVVKEIRPADTAPYSKPGSPIIPVGGVIDISGLPTGSYSLQAQATYSRGRSTEWSSAAFSIQ
jgi:hypothetical protein